MNDSYGVYYSQKDRFVGKLTDETAKEKEGYETSGIPKLNYRYCPMKIKDILPSPHQPATRHYSSKYFALKASILKRGITNPVVLRYNPVSKNHYILDGHGRWNVAKDIHGEDYELPCVIVSDQLDGSLSVPDQRFIDNFICTEAVDGNQIAQIYVGGGDIQDTNGLLQKCVESLGKEGFREILQKKRKFSPTWAGTATRASEQFAGAIGETISMADCLKWMVSVPKATTKIRLVFQVNDGRVDSERKADIKTLAAAIKQHCDIEKSLSARWLLKVETPKKTREPKNK